MAKLIVLEAHGQELYVEWRSKLEELVGYLRLAAGQYPDDEKLNALIGELCVKSELFATLWARHQVRDCANAVRRYRHPLVGEMTLFEEALRIPADPGQRIVVLSAEPGSPSAERLQLLANLDLPVARGHPGCDDAPPRREHSEERSAGRATTDVSRR
jgi:hypothetical protein